MRQVYEEDFIDIVFLLPITLVFVLSGCSVRCIFFVHEYEYVSSVQPTCTCAGYNITKCKYCGEISHDETTPALGHVSYIVEEGYPATCQHIGKTNRIACSRCAEIIESGSTIPKSEHTPEVTSEGYAATCTENGLTDKINCAICKAIIQPQTVIPQTPHTEVVTQIGYPSTCTQTGVSDEVKCSVCDATLVTSRVTPALGHNDTNGDSLCDVCSYPTGNDVISIGNAQELVQISGNLDGIYLLTADIVISGSWTAIGTDEHPFNGVLYGDGHTISGLTLSNCNMGGLFGQNNGTISNVNLANVSIEAKNRSCIIGGLVSKNNGTIYNCNIIDEIKIMYESDYSFSTGYPKYESKKVNYDVILGGICAVNNGTIEQCNVNAKLSSQFRNIAKYTLSPSALFYLPAGKTLIVTNKVYYGGIAGKNGGIVVDCRVSGMCSAIVKVSATLGKKYGMCRVTTETFLGSIVGLNSSKIVNCIGRQFSVVPDLNEDYVFTSNLSDQGHVSIHTANTEANYFGMIGKNSGNIENVTYCQ